MRHNRRDDGQLSCRKREMKTMNANTALDGHTTVIKMAERGGVPLINNFPEFPIFFITHSNNQKTIFLPYSRKFSSAKNFVNSDRQAVRQEYILVKRRSSLVCSSLFQLSLFCLSFIFAFMNISDPKLAVCEKI